MTEPRNGWVQQLPEPDSKTLGCGCILGALFALALVMILTGLMLLALGFYSV